MKGENPMPGKVDHAKSQFKVLIADDEPGMRELVRRFLGPSRFEIIEAASGKEALAAAPDAKKLDLLITDEMMPEMEGHELSRRMRQQNPDLRVLYLTGHSDHLFDKKERMWDLEAYLDKPFSQKSLNEAVALLMTGRLSFDS
jgi:two-component system cell cycle sensor histidine kinase/response regulator CckA